MASRSLSTPSKTNRSKSAYASTADRPTSSIEKSGVNPYLHQKLPRPSSYSGIPLRKPDAQWNQSSSTLRYSKIKYTIPQDVKLKGPKTNYYDHYKLTYPTFLSSRAT